MLERWDIDRDGWDRNHGDRQMPFKMTLIQPVRISVPDDCMLCLKRQVLTCRTADREYRSDSASASIMNLKNLARWLGTEKCPPFAFIFLRPLYARNPAYA